MFSAFNRILDYLRNVYIAYLVLMTSIFIYLTIYNIYIPKVHHQKQVHFEFDTKCSNVCPNPSANISGNAFRLYSGQSYRFLLSLDMPESEVNWKQGMFMINLSIKSYLYQEPFVNASRPAILKQKSRLTRWLHSLFYMPLIVLGFKHEMQTVDVTLIDNYYDGSFDIAALQLVARDIQVYSATLHIYANLSGLNYYMYNWPISSAFVGVSTLSSFMGLLSTYKNSPVSYY